jgi:Transcription factor Pcc1
MNTAATNDDYPYTCNIEIMLPTASMAVNLQRILSVDQEIGERVVKTLDVVSDCSLTVRFRATQAKMLRVSVSSFTEYLVVALKCYQEFDRSLLHAATTHG